VCDEDATLELRVKTVRYFKGIQETAEKMLQRPMEGYSGGTQRSRNLSPGASPVSSPLMVLPHGVAGSTRNGPDGAPIISLGTAAAAAAGGSGSAAPHAGAAAAGGTQ
jgi:hypothetical protein